MPKPHLAHITNSAFWRPGNGMWARTRALISYLSAQIPTTIVYLGSLSSADRQALDTLSTRCRVMATGREPRSREEMTIRVRTLLTRVSPTACLIENLDNAYLLDALPAGAIRILDCQDLLSQRTASMAKLGLEPDRAMDEATERAVIERFDLVAAIQQEDFKRINGWNGHAKAILAPHPGRCQPMVLRPNVTRIGMVASNFHPNVDGLNHFMQKVWPHLTTKDLQLHLYGNIAAGFRAIRFRNIHFHGIKPSLQGCYRQLDIVINPVRYGSGLKIKSVEALAHGLPLVTTREGARGLVHLDGKALAIADTDTDFAKAIDSLTNDRASRGAMASEGLAYVAQQLNPAACFAELTEQILGE